MKERPILFSGAMVRAILDGRKTQTRRVVSGLSKRFPLVNLHDYEPDKFSGRFNDPRSWGWAHAEDGCHMPLAGWECVCPQGQRGDRLWVRETWREDSPDDPERAVYRADEPSSLPPGFKWKPSIFMPRWASRITLEVVNVRVERLQEISEDDAVAEGIEREDLPPDPDNFHPPGSYGFVSGLQPFPKGHIYVTPREAYVELWDSLNAKRGYGWDVNPWVWVIELKRCP